jgi:NTE family protein
MKKEINTLILSGGGVRGIAYIGVFQALEELQEARNSGDCTVPNINIKNVCTVSIGSFLGLLYVIGYSSSELSDELMMQDLSDLQNCKIDNFVYQYGFDTGSMLIEWIETLLIKRGVSKTITFNELWKLTGINYQVLCTNLNTYKSVVFDYVNMPNLQVLKALRMSISVPFVFTAGKYKGDIYVDGGLTENYPIDLYKDSLDTVLGLKFVSVRTKDDFRIEIGSLYDYIYNVIFCYSLQKGRETTNTDIYKPHTVYLKADEIASLLNFKLTGDEKMSLIDLGYYETSTFFNKNIICINNNEDLDEFSC